MAESDSPDVLRQPVMAGGGRRLPTFAAGAAEPTLSASVDQRQLLGQLRQQFADELSALREETRQQGLAAARQEADASLRTLKEEVAARAQREADKSQQTLREAQQRLEGLLDALRDEQTQLARSMAPVVGRLALLVAVKLLGQHQQLRPLVADMVAQVLDSHQLQAPLRIHVATTDHERLSQSGLHESLLPLLVADASLGPGDCLVDHGAGRLEAGLDLQWEALKQALLSASGEERVAGA